VRTNQRGRREKQFGTVTVNLADINLSSLDLRFKI